MADLNLNARAAAIADAMVERAAELRIDVLTIAGARVIDAGISATGGFAAGKAMARACMADLGDISFAPLTIGGETYHGLQVSTDHPAVACMASQYAGWAINVDDYVAMGSGPLRSLARVEPELFDKLGYAEEADRGVIVLETREMPTARIVEWVGERASLPPSALTFIVAPTASLAGGVQIAARIVETGLHKISALGFDVRRIVSAYGTAPIPPAAKNDLRAIGRTNDCILYGGQARYTVRADDAELEALAEQLPASASSDYGTAFFEIFERYERDFYKIDKLLFSPGEVWLTNVATGRTFHAGALNPSVLRASLIG